MKFILLLIFSLLSLPAQAAETKPTQAQIIEALGVEEECNFFESTRRTYDCACMAARFLDFRMKDKIGEPREQMMSRTRPQCVNIVEVAGMMYQRCLGWPMLRPEGLEQFCSCVANRYAQSFSERPSDIAQARENMMQDSMLNCRYADAVQDDFSRGVLAERLRQQGLYELLVPSARLKNP